MARPSKIDRLPAAVREWIGEMRRAGHTIDEILEAVNADRDDLGEEAISRSGMHRHLQKIDALGERLRRQREVATAIVEKLGDKPDDKLFRLNIELMQGVLFEISSAALEGRGVELDPENANLVANALKNLSAASKTDVERVERIERRGAEKAKRAAATAAAAEGAERGMSKDTIEAIKASILGVKVA